MNLSDVRTAHRGRRPPRRRTRRCSCIGTRRPTGSAAWPTRCGAASIPTAVVTYIIDRNVNYTNVCVARCNFCAFYREVGHGDGYVLGFDEIFKKIEETRALGGVQLLLQGGHNPDLPLAWYEDLFRAVKQQLPGLQAARACRRRKCCTSRACRSCRCRDVIERLIAAGPRQHPGRRRRDPRRSRPQAAQLLQQGDAPTSGSTSCATRTRPACAPPRR